MSLKTKCPSCGADGMRAFYAVRDVPVHSCIMLESEAQARDFPRGHVELGICTACGFVSNMAFDPKVQDYSALYEDQQCFSPTFNAFAEALAAKLVEKYDVRHKDILEIGCGKADFLKLMCDGGDNRGVGIDPACDKDRMQGPGWDRITIVQDYYSDRYGHYTGDMVLCRHTLEHIYDTRKCAETIRRGIGDRRETIVFIEVPDVRIVLENFVFWDIYYEHCSYFSPGSLARLLRRSGFEVLDVSLGFDDQYLLVEARPAGGSADKRHPIEESVEDMVRRAERFGDEVGRLREHWIGRIKGLHEAGKKPVIWGSGSKCVAFLTTLGVSGEIGCVVDINPRRHGKYIAGVARRIMPPDHLREYQPEAIILMNPIYKNEVEGMARRMGLSAEIMTV